MSRLAGRDASNFRYWLTGGRWVTRLSIPVRPASAAIWHSHRITCWALSSGSARPAPGIQSAHAERFALAHLTLLTPNRARTLLKDVTMDLGKGGTLLVVGQSGVGKSSLLRAIAGLWTQGAGKVERPPLGEIFFLPQKPYMLLGPLRDQLLYPHLQRDIPEVQLREALKAVRLEDLPERVGGFEVTLDWADILSLGEQQRLAFARLLLNRPRYAVLDEATGAVGANDEACLYRQLQELHIQYISVGHRRSLLNYHTHVLDLQGPNAWKLLPIDQYRQAMPGLEGGANVILPG